jgi:8-oxo-dGTP pyrophosphatase MutT (NUDIX family)
MIHVFLSNLSLNAIKNVMMIIMIMIPLRRQMITAATTITTDTIQRNPHCVTTSYKNSVQIEKTAVYMLNFYNGHLVPSRRKDTSAFLTTTSSTTNALGDKYIATGFGTHRKSRNMLSYVNLTKLKHLQRQQCRMLSTCASKDTQGEASSPIVPKITVPRAAVSVAVRVQCDTRNGDDDSHDNGTAAPTFYLLIQRGTEPNKGMWSLPGGKIEYHETTFEAAKRELYEETMWSTNAEVEDTNKNDPLQWHNETVLTTDAIGDGYHYVIAHYFAKYPTVHVPASTILDPVEAATTFDMDYFIAKIRQQHLPIVLASDDAMDAQWYTMKEIHDMEMRFATVTCGVSRVLQLMELYDHAKLLLI